MKKIFYTTFFLFTVSMSANAQWTLVDLFHTPGDSPYDVEVPNDHTVWASLWNVATTQPYTPYYYRTIDGGANWDYGFVNAPQGYVISSLAPIDEDTCYAIMVNITVGTGGGIFKTTDGGNSWNQLAEGQIFDANSFPDFIYFWNPREGIAVGDANGPGTPFMEMYTTDDYGATWVRIPRENMPAGNVYGITNSYCVVEDRIWCQIINATGTIHQIWYSYDRGLHWKSADIPTPSAQIGDFVFSDSLHGVVVGNDPGFNVYAFNSKDGGRSWNQVNFTGTVMPSYIAAIPGTNTIVSSNPFAALGALPVGTSYSNDNGKSWTLIDNEAHSDLAYLNGNVGWSGQFVVDMSSDGGMFKWTGLLPVNLVSFTATNTGKSVMLNWKTASELNNAYFDVQRSTNGIDFTQIGKVLSKGNSSQLQEYSYEDLYLQTGKTYYRLKQVDNDGKFTYSKIVSVEIGTSGTIKISPNPVVSVMKVEGLDATAKTALVIYDGSGKMIRQATATGSNMYSFDVGQLPHGTYYLRVQANLNVTVLKFVKE